MPSSALTLTSTLLEAEIAMFSIAQEIGWNLKRSSLLSSAALCLLRIFNRTDEHLRFLQFLSQYFWELKQTNKKQTNRQQCLQSFSATNNINYDNNIYFRYPLGDQRKIMWTIMKSMLLPITIKNSFSYDESFSFLNSTYV